MCCRRSKSYDLRTFFLLAMEFVGPAGNTVSFMRFLYQQGERDLVEAIFENVRAEDTHTHANHPSHSH
jgi:hypothetical protein